MSTYAVKWREPDGQTFIGRLVLGPGALRLVGRGRGAEGPGVGRRFAYAELQGLRIGSRGTDRLDGRPALVVERPEGAYLVAHAGMGAPIVQELFDRLADFAPLSIRSKPAANPQPVCAPARIEPSRVGSTLGPRTETTEREARQ